MEHRGMVSSLNSLQEEPGMHAKSKAEIMRLLTKRLDINDVKRVTPDDIKISRRLDTTMVNVAYEVQVPMFSNIDILLTFDNTVALN